MNEPRATRYQRLRRRADAAAIACAAAVLAVIALTPVGAWIAAAAWAYGRGLPPLPHALLALLLFVLGAVVLCELAGLPARVYGARHVDTRYGARAASAATVAARRAEVALVILAAAWVAALVIQFSAVVGGAWWWALAAVLLGLLLVAALHGAPRVVTRAATARPLADGDLVSRLAALSRQAGTPVAGILEIGGDTGTLTAAVSGLGRSRRVFLSAELTRDWSADEVAVVVAHELAHHAHHDLARTIAFDAAVVSVGLWTADALMGAAAAAGRPGAFNLEALPAIALAAGVVWLAATPLRHAYSRRQERRADLFALRLTGGAGAFSAAVRRLAARHLAEERPSAVTRWLYHRHPPVADRLALAEAFAAASAPAGARVSQSAGRRAS